MIHVTIFYYENLEDNGIMCSWVAKGRLYQRDDICSDLWKLIMTNQLVSYIHKKWINSFVVPLSFVGDLNMILFSNEACKC